ncbi:MAG: 30S ribosomal protein S13 [Planctomycetes bacterium]|nr:30S ribosomal protein S13 [Planctomycetota bacterium]
MARIAGTDIPSDKKLKIALRYVYGLGPKLSMDVIGRVGLDPEMKARDLSEEDVTRINVELEKHFAVEGQLRRQIILNIQRLKDIRCYRGIRHIRKLPVRGQQTQSNARTRKGPRVTVAGKKK